MFSKSWDMYNCGIFPRLRVKVMFPSSSISMMKSGVTYCCYPKLNHLMREGEGPASPVEYATPKPLPRQLILDLVRFIKP